MINKYKINIKYFIVKFLVALKVYDFACCICGKGSKGCGNNPETVGALKYSLDAECCDKCNDTVVVPARLFAMFEDNI